ncbi:MFS transporter [Deinococcus malanensis]|uniref:MFS transporter n=1 Tax=Deinococcus malanensis TaxID=1706855 RepID=UPI00363DAC33
MTLTRTSPADVEAPPQALSIGLLLVILIVAFEAMAVSTVLPRVAGQLQGLSWYGWASSAFLLASLFGAVVSGMLADRRGLALGAAASLGVFAAGLLVSGLAPDMPAFVLGRFIQGLGAGGLGALPFAVITARYPEAARARMLAAVSSAWLLPALVGPLLASLMTEHWSWRSVFWGWFRCWPWQVHCACCRCGQRPQPQRTNPRGIRTTAATPGRSGRPWP